MSQSQSLLAAAIAVMISALLGASASVAATRAKAAAAPLTLERTISLPGVSGRIDHLAVDLKRKRLFVAELGNGTVEVVDLAEGRAILRISGLKSLRGSPICRMRTCWWSPPAAMDTSASTPASG